MLGSNTASFATRLLLAILAVSTSGCHSQEQLQKPAIDRAAADAKEHGKTTAKLGVINLRMPRQVASFDDPQNQMSHIDGTLMSYVSVPDESRSAILTWLKFTINEDLSINQIGLPTGAAEEAGVPRSLLPIKDNEIVVLTFGGNVTVDGITVHEDTDFPPLVPKHRYLLLLMSANPATHIFSIAGGGETIFSIGRDGDALTPLIPNGSSPVQQDVETKFHGSLAGIRSRRRAN